MRSFLASLAPESLQLVPSCMGRRRILLCPPSSFTSCSPPAPQLLLLLLGPLPPGKGGLQVQEGIQHQAAVVLDMLGLEGDFLQASVQAAAAWSNTSRCWWPGRLVQL